MYFVGLGAMALAATAFGASVALTAASVALLGIGSPVNSTGIVIGR